MKGKTMRSYPIWIDINSCAYERKDGAKTGNKSFGVIQHNTQNIKVGTSAINSHHFGALDISVKEDLENGVKTFQLSFTDGHTGRKTLLKRSMVRQKTREHLPLIFLDDRFNNASS
jgi:hypothetical protein